MSGRVEVMLHVTEDFPMCTALCRCVIRGSLVERLAQTDVRVTWFCTLTKRGIVVWRTG